MENHNYVCLQAWMVKELGLRNSELIIYSLIYSFSQAEGTSFSGSLNYLAEWTGTSKRSVIDQLKRLQERGLIEKEETFINNIKLCKYRYRKDALNFTASEKTSPPPVKKVHHPGEKTSPNNIVDTIEDNIEESIYSDKSSYISSSPVQRQNDAGTATQKQDIFINFPLLGGSYAAIPEDWCDKQQELFGESVNVRAEIKLAMAWCESNHLKKDWKKFLNNWFGNALSHGGSKIPYVKAESHEEIKNRKEEDERQRRLQADAELVARMMRNGEI